MQPILAVPRQDLSESAVIGLITTSPSVTLSYGAEWLDSGLNVVQDVTDYLIAPAGTVSSDVTATIHRSCSLSFDSQVPFDYLSDFVRPYMTITDNDTGVSATFHLGVYTLNTPDRDLSTDNPVLTFTGYDLLQLLTQQVGDSYEVASGSDPADAAATLIQNLIPGAEVAVTTSGLTLAAPLTWTDPSTTYLTIVNTLLAAVGYTPVWVDWDGVFQIQPWTDPSQVGYEWTFDVQADDNIVADQRASNLDLFDAPNWWRFVMNNLSAAPVEGSTQFTFQDDDPGSPTSVPNRGGRVIKAFYGVDATSYDALVNAAAVQIAADRQPAETFSVSTFPVPLAWHRDVLLYKDANLATSPPNLLGQRRVMASKWSLTLDSSTDMTWTWQTVASV